MRRRLDVYYKTPAFSDGEESQFEWTHEGQVEWVDDGVWITWDGTSMRTWIPFSNIARIDESVCQCMECMENLRIAKGTA
jgi:hypothetical protein